MLKSVRVVAVATGVVAAAVLIQGSMAGAFPRHPGDRRGNEITLRFDVRTSPFNYTDLGQEGPSAADVIVFNDTLLRRGREVGRQVGSCVLVDPSGLSNCSGVATLDGKGTITYAFENSPPPRKTMAITGGSGIYRTARGDGTFLEHGDGTATLTLSVRLR